MALDSFRMGGNQLEHLREREVIAGIIEGLQRKYRQGPKQLEAGPGVEHRFEEAYRQNLPQFARQHATLLACRCLHYKRPCLSSPQSCTQGL